jgi:hypothetical protein
MTFALSLVSRIEIHDSHLTYPCPGAVMSVHIFQAVPPHQTSIRLHAIVGYEDGSVVLYSLEGDQGRKTIEGIGWSQLWRIHEHKESGPLHFYIHYNRTSNQLGLQLWLWHCPLIPDSRYPLRQIQNSSSMTCWYSLHSIIA